MKWLFTILVVLLVAVMLGLYAHQDPGFVMFVRGSTSMRMSLSLFVILSVIGIGSLFVIVRLLTSLWGMPGSVRRWRRRQRRERAWRDTNRGLIELAQGNWEKAERFLIRHAYDSQTPLVNYLAAARAAQKLHRTDKRDEYLKMAQNSMANAAFAVELTQAELQIGYGQLDQALTLLQHLQAISPRHPLVLNLLARVYELRRGWGDLKELLPLLRKRNVFPPDSLRQLELRVFRELLTLTTQRGKAEDLQQAWRDVPRNMQQDVEMVRHYVRCLLTLELHDVAEVTLRDNLRRQFDEDLAYLYGLVNVKDKDKQLAAAETWLPGNERHPILLLTLGRLCLQNKLWGKARSYLDASLGIKPRSDTYRELGQLLEKINQPKEAAEFYRRGLLLAQEEKIDDLLTVTPRAKPTLPAVV